MKYLQSTLILMLIFYTGCGQVQEDNGHDFYFPLPDEPGELITSELQDFYVQTVVEDVSVPWGMVFLPDGRMLITEREGNVRMVRDGELLDEPLEGAPDVFIGGSCGLLDIALHPDYEENGWIYMTYSHKNPDNEEEANTALMRARLSDHSLVDQEVLLIAQPYVESRQHSGSRIAFKDGYVIFSIGDRGFDFMDTPQDLGTQMGKIIRLNYDGSIPSDNPFVDEEGALPELYTVGHRNTQGLAVNPETGDLWSNSHGPIGGDELNHIEKGENYGWPEISFGEPDPGTTLTGDTAKVGMRSPIHHWTPAIAPSGMDFVSSDFYPNWNGNLLIGALRGTMINRVELDGTQEVVHEEPLLEGIGRMRNVRQAPDGFIYASNESTSEIYRLIPADMIRTE